MNTTKIVLTFLIITSLVVLFVCTYLSTTSSRKVIPTKISLAGIDSQHHDVTMPDIESVILRQIEPVKTNLQELREETQRVNSSLVSILDNQLTFKRLLNRISDRLPDRANGSYVNSPTKSTNNTLGSRSLERDLIIMARGIDGLKYFGLPEQDKYLKFSKQGDNFMRDWFFKSPPSNIKTEDVFRSCPNEASRCIFTTDPSRFNETDLLIIVPGSGFDGPDGLNGKKMVRAHPNQKFAFQYFEQPHQYREGQMNIMNRRIGFNMTIHYQTDSSVWWPYGWKKPLPTPMILPKRNYASGKTRKVLFVTSRCNTLFRHREHFVAQLINYIDVDVYGKCIDDSTKKDPVKVFQVAKQYKFLIAIENGDCDDYITEKYFRYMKQVDTIPIVLGVRNHYETLAPPMSYIQASQFDTVEQLAAYLRVLDKNDEMYNQYFTWKTRYTLEYLPKPFCEICRKAREDHFKQTTVDMVKFHSLERCLKYNRYLVSGWEPKVTNYTFIDPWVTLKKYNSRGKPLRFP